MMDNEINTAICAFVLRCSNYSCSNIVWILFYNNVYSSKYKHVYSSKYAKSKNWPSNFMNIFMKNLLYIYINAKKDITLSIAQISKSRYSDHIFVANEFKRTYRKPYKIVRNCEHAFHRSSIPESRLSSDRNQGLTPRRRRYAGF